MRETRDDNVFVEAEGGLKIENSQFPNYSYPWFDVYCYKDSVNFR